MARKHTPEEAEESRIRQKEKSRLYYYANRQKCLDNKRRYHIENAAILSAKGKASYAKNREAAKAQQAEYRERNRLKIRAQQKIYYDSVREKRNAKDRAYYHRPAVKERNKKQSAQWRAKNAEKVKIDKTLYYYKNPEIVSRSRNRRASLLASRLHPNYNHEAAKIITKEVKRLTRETGIKYHLDHIIPLTAGGYHHHENLQPLPERLNIQKYNNPHWEPPSPEYKTWRDIPTYLWPEKLVPGFLARLLLD